MEVYYNECIFNLLFALLCLLVRNLLILFAMFSFIAGLVIFVTSIILINALRKVNNLMFCFHKRSSFCTLSNGRSFLFFFCSAKGTRKKNRAMVVYIRSIHCVPIRSLGIRVHCKRSNIFLQLFHVTVMGLLHHLKRVRLDTGVLVVFGIIGSVQIGGSSAFKGEFRTSEIRGPLIKEIIY